MNPELHITQPVILIYGVSGMELLHLVSLCQREGILCRPVSEGETCLQIDRLLRGEKPTKTPAGIAPIPGKFALLAGFCGHEERGTALVNLASPGVIKAVRTDHNGSWSFRQLAAAISQEYRAMKP